MSRNLQAEVTNSILTKLRAGVVPWRQPWSEHASGAMPRNAITGRAYSGVNVPLLWMTAQERAYTSPAWLTFKQALEAGGNVRRGERGSMVVFVGSVEREDDNASEPRKIVFLKSYTVFNVCQCDGIPADLMPAPQIINHAARNALADEFLQATGADIRHGEGRAYYARRDDFIMLPNYEAFRCSDAYYATAFHELAHWTGAPHRLNRVKGKRFGDLEYTFEELVAELTAAFAAAEFGMDHDEDAAAYIGGWIKFLTDHESAFMSAASEASKAVAFLRAQALTASHALAA